MLLGGTLSNGPQVNFSYSGGDLSANLQYAGQNIYAWGNGITPGLRAFFVGSAIYLVLAALVLAVLYFILGSVICVGYARFNLDLTGGEKPPFETLFTYFYNWKTLAVSQSAPIRVYSAVVPAADRPRHHGHLQLRHDGLHSG